LISTLRIQLSYTGSQVSFDWSQVLDHVPPPTDDLGDMTGQSGFWFELQDGQGGVLYRRGINNPIEFEVEIPGEDPDQPPGWQRTDAADGSFILDMPAIDEAANLVLVYVPPDDNADLPAGVVGTIALQEQPNA
jgi:hypothetical protein